ncbi:MAG: hypothetical protein ACE5E1_02990 [Phycisphaerae bacterium]
MAGVAPQHRAGSNATTTGMVIAVIVAVVLLGVLIWLFTLQEQFRSNTELARKAQQRATTELAEMKRSNQLLIRRITGNQNDPPADAVAMLDQALGKINTDEVISADDRARLSPEYGAATILSAFHELYQRAAKDKAELEATLQTTKADLAKAKEAGGKLRTAFDSKVAQLKSKIAELQQAKGDLEALKNGDNAALARQISTLRDALDQKRREVSKLKRQYRATIAELEGLLDEQRVVIRDLRGPLAAGAEPLAAARRAVGEVMEALPGNALVHVNLGRRDNVTLGMTFSVYAADERIPKTGRGKASIEVVSVGPTTSECRVVAPPAPGDPILPGDVVGNIVLSRSRGKKLRFCVIGDFDVDFDGQVDVRGRAQVQSLVRRWGGEVVDEVDALTDYVVMGKEPPGESIVPAVLAGGKPAEDELAEDEEDVGEDDEADMEEDDEGDEDEDEFGDDDEEWDDEDEVGDDDEEWDDEDEDGDEDEEWDDEDEDEDDGEDDDEAGGGNGGPGDLTVAGTPERPIIDPTAAPRTRRYQTEGQRYRDSLLRAKLFSIPVLTQDQFFNFIGIEGTVSDIRRLEG